MKAKKIELTTASHDEREIEITEINEKGIKKSLTRLRF